MGLGFLLKMCSHMTCQDRACSGRERREGVGWGGVRRGGKGVPAVLMLANIVANIGNILHE